MLTNFFYQKIPRWASAIHLKKKLWVHRYLINFWKNGVSKFVFFFSSALKKKIFSLIFFFQHCCHDKSFSILLKTYQKKKNPKKPRWPNLLQMLWTPKYRETGEQNTTTTTQPPNNHNLVSCNMLRCGKGWFAVFFLLLLQKKKWLQEDSPHSRLANHTFYNFLCTFMFTCFLRNTCVTHVGRSTANTLMQHFFSLFFPPNHFGNGRYTYLRPYSLTFKSEA